MKKLISLLLSLVLALSLVTAGFAANHEPTSPDPEPTPTVTVAPIDPEWPDDSPASPQDDPPDPNPFKEE